jgi:hypothetical protein
MVNRELDIATDCHLGIIPFRIEDITPSGQTRFYLAGKHWLDAITPPLEQHLETLVAAVQSLFHLVGPREEEEKLGEGDVKPPLKPTIIETLGIPPVDLPKELPTKKPKSKTLILISGGVIVITLVGSLLWIISSPPASKKPVIKPEVAADQKTPPGQVPSVPAPATHGTPGPVVTPPSIIPPGVKPAEPTTIRPPSKEALQAENKRKAEGIRKKRGEIPITKTNVPSSSSPPTAMKQEVHSKPSSPLPQIQKQQLTQQEQAELQKLQKMQHMLEEQRRMLGGLPPKN